MLKINDTCNFLAINILIIVIWIIIKNFPVKSISVEIFTMVLGLECPWSDTVVQSGIESFRKFVGIIKSH